MWIGCRMCENVCEYGVLIWASTSIKMEVGYLPGNNNGGFVPSQTQWKRDQQQWRWGVYLANNNGGGAVSPEERGVGAGVCGGSIRPEALAGR